MFTLADIAQTLGHPVHGDGSLRFRRASEPSEAGAEDLALAMSPSYGAALKAGQARAAILWDGADWQDLGLEGAVLVPRARLAMAGITAALDPGPTWAGQIHPTAVIDPSAEVGPRASIGPRVVIEAGARIGADAILHPGVVIGAGVTIGDRFICQPNAAIGADGFSFVTPEESGVERVRKTLGDRGDTTPQSWTRIHSIGSVTIGDDVEIGANATICKGTVADTRIGRGTKLDSLVMIGHNNQIGEDCLFCSQVGLAGGSVIGDRVVLAGQVGVNDNITIGDDVVAGGASKIFTRVAAGSVVLGHPATKMETQMASYKAIRRLPRMASQLAELRKTVTDLVQGKRHDTD